MIDFFKTIPKSKIANFCRRWRIVKLSVFGSILRKDYKPDSDLDILVEFSHNADWGLLDHVLMQQELEKLLNRNVDLVSEKAIRSSHNWIRTEEILNSARLIFQEKGAVHASG
jgi:predicted nucleotidyltransferase